MSSDPTIKALAKILSTEEPFRKRIWDEIGKLISLPTKGLLNNKVNHLTGG